MKFSIKAKAILMIISFAMVLSIVSVIISGSVMSDITNDKFRENATDISATVAKIIDVEQFLRVKSEVEKVFRESTHIVRSELWGTDSFNEYIAQFSYIEETEDFILLRDFLREIQSVNNVDCLYVSFVDPATESFVYVVDAALEDPCPAGCVDRIYDVNKRVLTEPEVGFPAYITDTEEYGKLVTAGVPIYDEDGEVVGYSIADISMEEISDTQTAHILKLAAFLAVSILVICIIGFIYVNRSLVRPLVQLSDAAKVYTDGSSPTEQNAFRKLKIKNKDEIGTLANSMKQMERDMNKNMKKLLKTNADLSASRSIASSMTRLAKKDALTGVRNKKAYDDEASALDSYIDSGSAEFGVVMIDVNNLKSMNDEHGHDKGDKYIITNCEAICEIFDHSPVYRVGGDEFIVIVKKYDYNNIEALAEKFNERVDRDIANESLDPWDKVFAALGYALYDKTRDKNVEDVFKRADAAMYERKREMKGKTAE
ncbi:MAG: diguanylate cyclase [Clostridia bacterium]|nr:diguanylate cyclase [Clostridia bacterium]